MTHARKILLGSASNVLRVILSMVIALLLPPLLVHRLNPAEYAAWVLILQCSGYVSLLDLGLQTAIGKFVAEYDALDDRPSSSRILSSSFVILCVSALVGAVGISVITWLVPRLFHQMPVSMIGDVREGILVVGLSTAIALPFAAFMAVFTGLQRYGFPAALSTISKIVSSAGLVVLLLMHGSLTQLCWVIAIFNLATGIGQFVGWKRYASDRVEFGWRMADRGISSRLVKYGSVLSIWLIAGLLISGLDIVIVGHYDFANTGYYGIATSVTNFMLMIIGGIFGPLLPAVSSLQAGHNQSQIGELTVKSTRYCALLLSLFGLPLIFAAYPLLRLWVGHAYATRSVVFLQVLVVGNAIRQLGLPYSVAVLATGKQHLATIAGVAEAMVNISVSLYLVQHIGAVGVAIGTVVGAFVSVCLHLTLSMRFTQSAIGMRRRDFLIEGLVRPLTCILPSLLLISLWNRTGILPWRGPWFVVWIVGTLLIAWQVSLTANDRARLKDMLSRMTRAAYARAV